MRNLALLFVLLCGMPGLTAQTREPPRGSVPSPLDALRYTLRSQQSDLRMIQERLGNYEEQMDLVREDLKRDLAEQDNQNARALRRLEMRFENNEERLADLTTDAATLRRDFSALVDHVKELHHLVEALQTNLQQQTKKNQVLEKTLSTLVNSLGGSSALGLENPEHKVQSGETLEKIARKYGTTIRLLKEQNQLESDRIRVGQTLKLPSSPPATSP